MGKMVSNKTIEYSHPKRGLGYPVLEDSIFVRGYKVEITDPIVKTEVGYFFIVEGMEFGPFLSRDEAEYCYKKAREYYEKNSKTS